MIRAFFKSIGTLLVMALVAVAIQGFFWACTPSKTRKDLAKAEQTCFATNQRYISQGACERCRVHKLPNGQVNTLIDFSACKTANMSAAERALEAH